MRPGDLKLQQENEVQVGGPLGEMQIQNIDVTESWGRGGGRLVRRRGGMGKKKRNSMGKNQTSVI